MSPTKRSADETRLEINALSNVNASQAQPRPRVELNVTHPQFLRATETMVTSENSSSLQPRVAFVQNKSEAAWKMRNEPDYSSQVRTQVSTKPQSATNKFHSKSGINIKHNSLTIGANPNMKSLNLRDTYSGSFATQGDQETQMESSNPLLKSEMCQIKEFAKRKCASPPASSSRSPLLFSLRAQAEPR